MFQFFYCHAIFPQSENFYVQSPFSIYVSIKTSDHLICFKIPKMTKNHVNEVFANYVATRFFLGNRALSLFIIYHGLTLCLNKHWPWGPATTALIAMNDYFSLFKSYEFLNCTMFICSNQTTPSTLNPDLIFHFYCGFDQTHGLAFNFDFDTDL